MKTSFTYLKGNCPVCQGSRKDCRQFNDLFFCRTDNPSPDFIFKKHDAHGFGIFVEQVLQEEQDADRREQYRQEREQEKQQRLAEEANRRARSLSAEERDREIKKLSNQLSLNEKDRSDLKHRGLTDEVIRAGMFCSVDQSQKLSEPVSSQLAGVNIDGRSLTNNQPGYICPIRNCDGLMVGWQLRLDNADEGGKYRWPSSRGKKRPNGPTAHLPNGELPLTFCRPQGKPKGIGLIEGILKPAIAAHLSGDVMIGAAGGQFRVSQEQLKEGLAKLSAELGTDRVILFPDAGSVSNWQVHRRDCDTIRLVQSWGYTVLIADWGQFQDKSQPDYDELLASGGEVDRFMPAAEYLALASVDRTTDNDEPDPEEYRSHEAERDSLEANEEAEAEYNLYQRIESLFEKGRKKIAKRLNRVRRHYKGFATLPQAEPIKILRFKKGGLPNPEEYIKLGSPLISYQAGNRIAILKEARAKGWKNILDTSKPGCGKSHDSGNLDLRDFSALGIERLFYIDNNHSNPSTSTLEEWTNLEPRHNGLVQDTQKLTSTGRPWIRHPQPSDDENLITIEANCHKARIFTIATQKNLPLIGGNNPVCGNCKILEDCKASGYKHHRKEALKEFLVRAHPVSMPRSNEFDYNKSGLIWEEFDQSFTVKRDINIERTDFLSVFEVLKHEFPTIDEELNLLKGVLSKLFGGEIEVHKRYGLSAYEMLQLLPEKPEDREAILEAVKSLQSYLTNTLVGNSDDLSKLENSPVNWLITFLEIWLGIERGSFAFKNETLTISIQDNHCRSMAQSAAWNLFLDGTATRDTLALKIGYKPEEILIIEQEVPDFSNLNVIQIKLDRHIDKKRRSKELTDRINAIKPWIKAIHGKKDVAFFDFKGHDRDATHYVDSRGSNAYEGKLAIASIGDPYTSLGDAAAEWVILTGNVPQLLKPSNDDEETALIDPDLIQFQAFYISKLEAIIEQEIGRLRAHRRSNQPLTYYYIGEADLSFLREKMPGVKLQTMTAFEFDPEAGTAEQRTRRALLDAYARLRKLKQRDPTQQELAEEGGISQGYLSKISSRFGGWKALKQLFLGLLDSLYRGRNNSANTLKSLPEWVSKVFGLSSTKEQLALLATQVRLVAKKGLSISEFLSDLDIESHQNLLDLVLKSLPRYLLQAWEEMITELLGTSEPLQGEVM